MIEFAGLFLFLVTGPLEIEVSVAAQVAAVELELDGKPAGRMEGEPWRRTVDLGRDLLPHDLRAVALDGQGRRIGETWQRINFGRELVEARWAVAPAEGWPPRRARLIWSSFDGSQPRSVTADLDGQALELDDRGWVTLPAYDGRETHNLHGELVFSADLETRADLVFGGTYGDTVHTEESSVALDLPEGVPLPSPGEASTWIQKNGEALTVSAVAAGPAFVVLVKDRSLVSPLPMSTLAQVKGDRLRPRRLERQDRLFFVQTSPDASKHDRRLALFQPFSVEGAYGKRGILYAARRLEPPKAHGSPQHLLDAAAVAGQLAARSGRPRAVLLLQGPDSEGDASQVLPEQLATFLQALQVPFVSWSSNQRGGGSQARRGLLEAVTEVSSALEGQVVLSVEGRHLPRQITLSPAAPEGLRFAGGAP